MIISGSFLKIQDEKEKIRKLSEACDQIHFDIMDGIFTENKTVDLEKLSKDGINKPIDVHLMVYDVKSYVDRVLKFNPKYITFHIEINKKTEENINYIKSKNIKVGLAINPETPIESIYKYLNMLDLVLIMSVHPGKGGQKFMDITDRIDKLVKYRDDNNLQYLIEVDGGINSETIKKIKHSDIAVSGSFITDSENYKEKVNELRRSLDE